MKPVILYFAPEDWAFLEHFSIIGSAAIDAGFEVFVATRVREHRAALEAKGFRVVAFESERSNLGAAYNIVVIARMVQVILRVKPALIHCIGLRMVFLAGCAARMSGIRHLLLMPTGLGDLWLNTNFKAGLLRRVIRLTVGRILNRQGTEFIFENADDPIELGLPRNAANLTILGGVGVDPNDYPYIPEPEVGPIKVAVVARMLESKGIAEAVAAVRQVQMQGVALELHLYGATDPSNRLTLKDSDLRRWETEGAIFWHGRVADIGRIWQTHHIAMLLSYREGLSRSLIEAAAAGRPIVTTDVVGCRDIIRDGVEGFIVPKGDVGRPAARLLELATNANLRQQMGTAAHARFMERFTADVVRETVLGVYRQIKAGLH